MEIFKPNYDLISLYAWKKYLCILKAPFLWYKTRNIHLNPLSANPTKMVKHTQTIRRLLPTHYFIVFDHYVELAFKGLISKYFALQISFLNLIRTGCPGSRYCQLKFYRIIAKVSLLLKAEVAIESNKSVD